MIEYEKDAIVHSYITDYMRREIPTNDGILAELENYASEHNVPIVQPETAQLLTVLGHIKKPQSILEIGCAIGYSAILMAQTLSDGGNILTIEYNEEMAKLAKQNIERAGLSSVINVTLGDAKQLMPTIDGQYDVIFLDGPKGHYIHMLDDCIRLLRKGGILIADNVLYKGMTAENSLVIRRKITIVKRLRRFITELNSRSELKTSLLPVGDGVTISVKL